MHVILRCDEEWVWWFKEAKWSTKQLERSSKRLDWRTASYSSGRTCQEYPICASVHLESGDLGYNVWSFKIGWTTKIGMVQWCSLMQLVWISWVRQNADLLRNFYVGAENWHILSIDIYCRRVAWWIFSTKYVDFYRYFQFCSVTVLYPDTRISTRRR